MRQITATRNLVATKVVRLAGQIAICTSIYRHNVVVCIEQIKSNLFGTMMIMTIIIITIITTIIDNNSNDDKHDDNDIK